jgi:hypothetical protein
MIQPGLPVCIVELLATAHTLKNDKGMRKEKGNVEDWNFLSDLCPRYKVTPLHQWKRGPISTMGAEQPLWFCLSNINNEVLNHSSCSLGHQQVSIESCPFPPLILKLTLPMMTSGGTMADAPTVGVPAAMVACRHPIAQGRAPLLVVLHCRPGESSCTDVH